MPAPGVLAVVGGGRWGRQYLSVLRAMPLPLRLVLVSRHAEAEPADDATGASVMTVPDLDDLLAAGRPAAAIVVNAAMAHDATAMRLLEAGVPVLVEKPAATDAAAATALADAARRHGASLVPALSFRHCAYLDRYAAVVRATVPRVDAIRIDWADPPSEVRYGAQKGYDRGIGIALDVLPHVWSMLASVLGPAPARVEACSPARGGRGVAFALRWGSVAVQVGVEREAAARRRLIAVPGGPSIDFGSEPGTIRVGADAFSGDADWATRTDRPLRRQVEAFLRTVGGLPRDEALQDLCASVALAAECDRRVKDWQRGQLARVTLGAADDDILCAVRELLAPRLVRSGRMQAGDRAALDACVQAVREQAAAAGATWWLEAVDGVRA